MSFKPKLIFVFLFYQISSLCYGQGVTMGLLPSINLNHKLKKEWHINYKLESRFSFIEESNALKNNDFLYNQLTDLTTLVSKKIFSNQKLVFGVLLRSQKNVIIPRMIFQYILSKQVDIYTYSNRFVYDYTHLNNTNNEHRLRYRFAIEIPLNGHNLDSKEFYLKHTKEYLLRKNEQMEQEIRISPFLGYTYSLNTKLEMGIDYRLNMPVKGIPSHDVWIAFNWFTSL